MFDGEVAANTSRSGHMCRPSTSGSHHTHPSSIISTFNAVPNSHRELYEQTMNIPHAFVDACDIIRK
jgi:hypothetical protein